MDQTMIIKATSMYEPWASAVRLGLKKNETRSKNTNYRGWLAIQSAKKKFDPAIYNQAWVNYVHQCGLLYTYDYGMITCIVHLDDCIPTEKFNYSALSFDEKQWGDYGPKRFVMPTSRLIILPSLIPCRGRNTMLFDWEVPKELEYLLG